VASASVVRILLVEDRADWVHGHFAPLLRQMAEGFVAGGHEVTVLTALGLHVDDSARTAPSRWSVRRYGLVGRGLERLVRLPDRPPWNAPWRRRVRMVTVRLRSLLMLLETRRVARSLGDPASVAVVVSSMSLYPQHVAVGAPTRGHWVAFRHAPAPGDRGPADGVDETGAGVDSKGPAPGQGRAEAQPSSLFERLAAARARSRTAHGGRLVIVGSYGALVESWRRRVPWLDTGTVALPVEVASAPVERSVARRRLGLPADRRVALFFGSIHPGKDPDTVWASWCLDPPPTTLLVAAGHGVRRHLDRWLADHPDAHPEAVHVIDGGIDEATKQLLFAAADVGILCFRSRPIGASATLCDFAAAGRPVCCSSGGDPAELTRAYGLGVVFDASDPASLADAVSTVGTEPDPAGLARYLADFSPAQVAQDLLDLLFPTGV